MSSSYIKEFVSGTLHTSFNYLIPSNTLIGAISGGVGFYTRALVITYPGIFSWGVNGYYVGICSWGFSFAPTFLENHFDLKNRAIDIGNAIGFLGAPFVVPQTINYNSEACGVASALATSLILNLIAKNFFGVEIKKEGKKIEHVVKSLKDMGLEIPSCSKTSSTLALEPHQSPFKDIFFPSELAQSIGKSSENMPIATLKESNSTPLPRAKKMNIEKEEKSLIFNGKRPPILGKEELKLALQTTQKLNTTYLPLPNSAILDDNNDCPCPCPSLCF